MPDPLMILLGGSGKSSEDRPESNSIESSIREKLSEPGTSEVRDRRPEVRGLMAEFDDKSLPVDQRIDALKLIIKMLTR